jgi:hypothetical protein
MHIRDPREPAVIAWLDTLPPDTLLVMLFAMSYSFPYLQESKDWRARTDAAFKKVRPDHKQHQELIERAMQVAENIQAELGG